MCFILERALVERLKAFLRKLSLKSFGMECEVRARCFVFECSHAFRGEDVPPERVTFFKASGI